MDALAYQQAAAAEDDHWWYRGRRRIVNEIVSQLDHPRPAHVLDAGCGTGRNLVDLIDLGPVAGIEPHREYVEIARSRGLDDVHHGVVEDLPFESECFDLITCLDVIEHVSDDRAGFAELRRVLRPDGHLLVTVPAYRWLWSHHDVINHHYRRYNHRELIATAASAGWRPLRHGYFNTFLLPPAAAVRLGQRLRPKPRDRGLDLAVTPLVLNTLLELPLKVEAALIRRGKRLPAGVSVFAVFVP